MLLLRSLKKSRADNLQVRYPLYALADMESLTASAWEFIGRHTPLVPGLATMQPLLLRAMIHYVTWNRMIEAHAEWRYRVEDVSIPFVCMHAGLILDRCYKSPTPPDSEAQRGPRGAVSWAQLQAVSPAWAGEVQKMAARYGYGRAGWQPPLSIRDTVEV